MRVCAVWLSLARHPITTANIPPLNSLFWLAFRRWPPHGWPDDDVDDNDVARTVLPMPIVLYLPAAVLPTHTLTPRHQWVFCLLFSPVVDAGISVFKSEAWLIDTSVLAHLLPDNGASHQCWIESPNWWRAWSVAHSLGSSPCLQRLCLTKYYYYGRKRPEVTRKKLGTNNVINGRAGHTVRRATPLPEQLNIFKMKPLIQHKCL